MKNMIAICIGVLMASPVFADEANWTGVWTGDYDWCKNADRIGSITPAPIRLTATEMQGYENSCEITSVKGNDEYAYYELTTKCSAEGETYTAYNVLMMDGADVLYIWYGAGEPVKFIRCGD